MCKHLCAKTKKPCIYFVCKALIINVGVGRLELPTSPKAFGARYFSTSKGKFSQRITHSVIFLLFFFLRIYSAFLDNCSVGNSKVLTKSQGIPNLVDLFIPLLCCLNLLETLIVEPI